MKDGPAISAPSTVLVGDVMDGLRSLPDGCVHCCVTSPPYWGLRDYGVEGQIGLEATPDAFVARMVEVFGEVRRVMRDDASLWLNLGDCYAGSGRGGYAGGLSTLNGGVEGQDNSRAARERQRKGSQAPTVLHARSIESGAIGRAWTPAPEGMKQKDLCMMPWRVALALQADGWWIRSVIVWAKKSPMPESCRDRPTSSWEPIFLLTKSDRYFYDAEAVKQPDKGTDHARNVLRAPERSNGYMPADSGIRSSEGRNGTGANLRNVWHLGPEPYADAHFATFPTEIPRRAIKAGTSEKGCCPACGAGWVRNVQKPQPPEEIRNRGNGAKMDFHSRSCGGGQKLQDWYDANPTKTLGWSPSCECSGRFEWREEQPDDPDDKPTRVRIYLGDADPPVPALVLDPFLGSGTTVAVARELGRHGVGCELNPEYAELARERIGRAEKPLTFRSSKATDGGLFTEGHQ